MGELLAKAELGFNVIMNLSDKNIKKKKKKNKIFSTELQKAIRTWRR